MLGCRGGGAPGDSDAVDDSASADTADVEDAPAAVLGETVWSTVSTGFTSGTGTVDVEVGEDVSAWLLSAVSADVGRLNVREVRDPAGQAVFVGAYTEGETPDEVTTWIVSGAQLVSDVAVLNWPPRGADGPLEPGTWEVDLVSWTAPDDEGRYWLDGAAELTVALQQKQDEDDTVGTVRVTVHYTAAAAAEPGVPAAIEAGVSQAAAHFGGLGLTLDITWGEDLDVEPFVDDGQTWAGLAQAAALGDDGDLHIVVVEGYDDGGTRGATVSAPSSMVEGVWGGITLGWLPMAGTDGVFSDEEVRRLGDTLAHELGHHMGLAHPVDDDWTRWDALDDTPECDEKGACEAALGGNLMYPFSLSCESTPCPGEMSDQQLALVHRYVGTL